MSMAAAGSFLRIEEIQGRGRSLVASQPLKAGQIILRDSPILLYSALPFIAQLSSLSSLYCGHCFRILPSSFSQGCSSTSMLSCPTCSLHRFCSSKCMSSAIKSSHSAWVCQALSRLQTCASVLSEQPIERQVQARFLIAAYNLAFVSPSNFQILLSLHGSPDDATASVAQFLHPLISALCLPISNIPQNGFSLELTAALLAKDKLNAFGLMQPFTEDNSQRSVRAYGIYPNASFFNHDCLPNACRFDYIDTSAPDEEHNTDIIIRMIHDVPQGREICLSYFPVNENYSSRQRRLVEDYGFTCNCDRCNVEANWSDNDDVNEAAEDEEGLMDEDQCENISDEDIDHVPDDDNTDFPHAYFFLRYMCDKKNCGGTLAPLPLERNISSNFMECNVCGNLQRDDGLDADGGQNELPMED